MASKKVIIGVAVVVVVIIIAALAMGGSSSPNARYDYTLSLTDEVQSTLGYTDTPDEGYTFLEVRYTLANDSFSSAITTNNFLCYFEATVGGLTYTADWSATDFNPEATKVDEISAGASTTSIMVIQIPAGTALEDVQVLFHYDKAPHPTWTKDDSLM